MYVYMYLYIYVYIYLCVCVFIYIDTHELKYTCNTGGKRERECEKSGDLCFLPSLPPAVKFFGGVTDEQ